MSKNRIKQNFYTVKALDFKSITKADREKMSEEEKEYWKDKHFWYVSKTLPDGRLYAGWGSRYPTKLTPADLPDDYIRNYDYKKNGFIRTSGVKDLVYAPAPFHNHAFKDDYLYISYGKKLPPYKAADWGEGSTYAECDEYIWGNNIVDFIFAVEKNSPDVNVADIKRRMVEQYNAYCDEMNEWGYLPKHIKIKKLEDLRA